MMKKWAVLLLALALLLAVTVGASAETWAETYARAGAAYAAGNLEEASRLYAGIPEYKDSRLKIRQITAELLFAKGNYARAWDVFSALDTAYHTRDTEFEALYAEAADKRAAGDYAAAEALFASLGSYRDSAKQAMDTVLRAKADELFAAGHYDTARSLYSTLGDADKVSECSYLHAATLGQSGEFIAAAAEYASLGDYSDSRDKRYAVGLDALNAGMVEEAWTILDACRDYRDPTEDLYQAAVAAGSRNDLSVAVPIYQKLGSYKDCAMRIAMVGYQYGSQLYDEGEYLQAGNVFHSLGKLSDAEARTEISWYAAANANFDEGDYIEAIKLYALVPNYQDSQKRTKACNGFLFMEKEEYSRALSIFSGLGDFEDSKKQAQECRYQIALKKMNDADYLATAAEFDGISTYRDSATLAKECRYLQAGIYKEQARYDDASKLYDGLAKNKYKESETLSKQCHYLRAEEHLAANATEKAYNEYVKAATYQDAVEKSGMTASTLALEATQKGDYEGAIAWYVKAGEYPGAKEAIEFIGEYYMMTAQYDLAFDTLMKVIKLDSAKETMTNLGIAYYRSNEHDKAKKCFKISGYTGEELSALREEQRALLKKAGSYITMGTYMQTASGDDSTPIEWVVLEYDSKNNRALLISRYGLDVQPYHTEEVIVTWEQCSLRAWLNSDFYNRAFNTEEKRAVLITNVDNGNGSGMWDYGGNNTQDKVFLLSFAEAVKYYDVQYSHISDTNKSEAAPTEYAIKRGDKNRVYREIPVGRPWWLRSPGVLYQALAVSEKGSVNCTNVNNNSIYVRPAFWIDLNADIF